MSVHALPAGLDPDALRARLLRSLRAPSGVQLDAPNGTPTAVEFTPDLSAAEQTTLATLLAQAQAPARLRTQYTALRQWSTDAAAIAALPSGTNVSQAQIKALFDRFGKLCDGMADLLLTQALDS